MIVRHREAFAERGALVLAVGTPEVLHQLENKVEIYRALAGEDWIRLPDYQLARTVEEFDDAVARLGAKHKVVCFKPAVSLFGLGFHILREGSSLDRMLGSDPVSITLEQARRCLMEREHFAPLVVMEYLGGAERSVDCLGWQGRLVRCVVRRKLGGPGNEQLLEDNPEVVDMARRVTRHFHLGAVFNVQFRDVEGVPHLLEINPRMSGGLHLADLSGLSFAYWAVRLALGDVREEDIPHPRTGLRVGHVYQGVILEGEAS
jgi:hypothetical protein